MTANYSKMGAFVCEYSPVKSDQSKNPLDKTEYQPKSNVSYILCPISFSQRSETGTW